jgi:glucuronosyltransferase
MITAKKHGVTLAVTNFTSDELLKALKTVMTDPIYKETLNKLSAIMKHRPMSARDTAAFWIEHVMMFGGSHLRSHGYDMPWYEFLMLDMLACLLLLEAVIVGIVVCLCQKVCQGRQAQHHKEKQN